MKVPNSEGEGKDDEDHDDVSRVEPSVVDTKKNDGNNATKRRKDKKKKSVKSKWEINFFLLLILYISPSLLSF